MRRPERSNSTAQTREHCQYCQEAEEHQGPAGKSAEEKARGSVTQFATSDLQARLSLPTLLFTVLGLASCTQQAARDCRLEQEEQRALFLREAPPPRHRICRFNSNAAEMDDWAGVPMRSPLALMEPDHLRQSESRSSLSSGQSPRERAASLCFSPWTELSSSPHSNPPTSGQNDVGLDSNAGYPLWPRKKWSVLSSQEIVTNMFHYINDVKIPANEATMVSSANDDIRAFDSASNKYPISLIDYMKRVVHYMRSVASPVVQAGCLLLLERLDLHTGCKVTSKNVYRLFAASFFVAYKVIEDEPHLSNARLAQIAGLTPSELSSLEVKLCTMLSFDLGMMHDAELQQQIVSVLLPSSEVGVDDAGIFYRLDMSKAAHPPGRTPSPAGCLVELLNSPPRDTNRDKDFRESPLTSTESLPTSREGTPAPPPPFSRESTPAPPPPRF